MFKRILGGLILTTFFVTDVCAKTENLSIDGDHGKLAAVIQTPDNVSQYPLVMILHGLAARKNMDLLQKIADKLEKHNIASIRFDFNGHGESEGNFQDMTILNEAEDAKKVYEYVHKLPAVTSIGITGHSQGGVVTSLLAAEFGTDNVKAIVLMTPAAVLHDYAVNGGIFGVTFDPDNLPEYVPLSDKIKIGRQYMETTQKLDMYAPAEQYTGPVLIVHGTGDVVVPYRYGQKYNTTYPNSQIVPLEGVDHLFTGYTDEVAEIVSEYFVKQLQ